MWFDAFDVLVLQSVSEGLLFETAILLRSDGTQYAEVTDSLSCRIFPPGVMKAELRSLVPHLRGEALGAIEVKSGDELARSIGAKDRLRVTTQGDRLFEVIAPLTARTVEIRRKLIVREIHPPERVLYLALRPDVYDGASSSEPIPQLVKVTPHAYIVDKPVEMVSEKESGGMEAVSLKQIMASEISRSFFSDANLERLLYCLVVSSDIEVTAEDAAKTGKEKIYPRFLFNGSPSMESFEWGRDFPYRVTLVEDR